MNFEQAFSELLKHEGGYSNDPRGALQYVNEYKSQNRLRIGILDAYVSGVGGSCPNPRCRIHLRSAGQLARVRLSGAGVCAPSLRQGMVQCALHPRPQGVANGVPGAREEARRCLCRVWRSDGCEGRLGPMPASLQTGPLRDVERRGCRRLWFQVRTLRRVVSPGGVRLPSSRRQVGLPQRDVPQQVDQRLGSRVSQVHLAVCQLPPAGASR